MEPTEAIRRQDVPRDDPVSGPGQDARFAVAAAGWAPSVHNTQPWRFGVRGSRIILRADADRRLNVADPDGREMLISCGTALFTLRIALRRLGYAPCVRLLPDPDRPHLLADVEFTQRQEDNGDAGLLYVQIRERRTHRGTFRPGAVPTKVQSVFCQEAQREGANLRFGG